MTPTQAQAVLIQTLELAWKEGSPVAGSTPEDRGLIADRAERRIRTVGRRNVDTKNATARIKDLAKGLIGAFESAPDLVGPLRLDYEHLAQRLIDAYDSAVQ